MKLKQIIKLWETEYPNAIDLEKTKQFLTEGDDLQAWQTVLGSKEWLERRDLPIDWLEVEKKAEGIGKWWRLNGQLGEEAEYKNGQLHGGYKSWYDDGELRDEATYKNGVRL